MSGEAAESIAIAEPHAEDVARLQVDGERDRWGIWRGQTCGKDGGADVAGNLADSDIETEVRVFDLGDANGIVESSGQVGAAGDDVLEVLGGTWLLGKARGGNDGGFEGAGERDAESSEETAAEAGALTADAIDGAVGQFEAEVDEEGHWGMEPLLGTHNVNILIVVGVLSAQAESLFEMASDELIASAGNEAGGNARSPRTELAVFHGDDLTAEDVHSIVVPQFAEGAVGHVYAVAEGVNAAGVTEFGAVGEALGKVNGLDISDNRGAIDEVITKSGM